MRARETKRSSSKKAGFPRDEVGGPANTVSVQACTPPLHKLGPAFRKMCMCVYLSRLRDHLGVEEKLAVVGFVMPPQACNTIRVALLVGA